MTKTFFMDGKNKPYLVQNIDRLDPTKLWRFRIDEYDHKTREQEEKAHAMIADIARQAMHLNQVLDAESWKRLLVDDFRADSIASDIPRVADYWRRNQVKLMPSLDGHSLVLLGAQTRNFPKYVYAAFITYLEAYGANKGIAWSKKDLEQAA